MNPECFKIEKVSSNYYIFDWEGKIFKLGENAKSCKIDVFSDCFYVKEKDFQWYTISCAITGFIIGKARTLKEAKQKVYDRINALQFNNLSEIINDSIKRNGLSPRYKFKQE